jgi:hypothetical protein
LRKILNLSFALALVAGLFAGSLASVGAAGPSYGPQEPGNNMLFFPFVHNGTTEDGMNFTGSVVIQNLEVFPINVHLQSAGGGTDALLNPRASKTFSAAALKVPTGSSAQGVIATASYPQSSIDQMLSLNVCKASLVDYDQNVTPAAMCRTPTHSRRTCRLQPTTLAIRSSTASPRVGQPTLGSLRRSMPMATL